MGIMVLDHSVPLKPKPPASLGAHEIEGIFVWMLFHFVSQRITEFSELEWTHKDPQVQIWSEWPRRGLNPQRWCYWHHAPTNWAYLLPTWKYKGEGSCSMGLERWTLHHKSLLFPRKAAPYWVYGCWRGRVMMLLLEIHWTLVLSCTLEHLKTDINYLTMDKEEKKDSKAILSLTAFIQFSIYLVHFLTFLVKSSA